MARWRDPTACREHVFVVVSDHHVAAYQDAHHAAAELCTELAQGHDAVMTTIPFPAWAAARQALPANGIPITDHTHLEKHP